MKGKRHALLQTNRRKESMLPFVFFTCSLILLTFGAVSLLFISVSSFALAPAGNVFLPFLDLLGFFAICFYVVVLKDLFEAGIPSPDQTIWDLFRHVAVSVIYAVFFMVVLQKVREPQSESVLKCFNNSQPMIKKGAAALESTAYATLISLISIVHTLLIFDSQHTPEEVDSQCNLFEKKWQHIRYLIGVTAVAMLSAELISMSAAWQREEYGVMLHLSFTDLCVCLLFAAATFLSSQDKILPRIFGLIPAIAAAIFLLTAKEETLRNGEWFQMLASLFVLIYSFGSVQFSRLYIKPKLFRFPKVVLLVAFILRLAKVALIHRI